MPQGAMFEMKKFYYDTAGAANPGAIASLLKLVASVNGRRPDSAFSRVEMLIFARSARPRREMRRRASSSRTWLATRRLCWSVRF